MEDVTSALEYWPSPPPWGWKADDLDLLPLHGPNGEPDFFKHVELIDGALVFMSPQRRFHERVSNALRGLLNAQGPADLAAVTQMDVKIGKRMRPCPDVLVVTAAAADDQDRTYYVPDEVRLVVEVVSPESEDRDRLTKPLRYAQAGIPHFWRVEENNALADGLAWQASHGRSATDIQLAAWWEPTGRWKTRLIHIAVAALPGLLLFIVGVVTGDLSIAVSAIFGAVLALLAGGSPSPARLKWRALTTSRGAASFGVGLAVGLGVGLAVGADAWTRYHVAVVVNAARKRGPLRFGAFLNWAHQAGLLRVSGIAYQFRHRQLQDLLTSPGEP